MISSDALKGLFAPPMTLFKPSHRPTTPIIINIPHSGRSYPQPFLDSSRLTPLLLRKSEDAYIDVLLKDVAAMGLPMLTAHFPRAWLDVNREPFELDPLLFRDALPSYANHQSSRVIAGLGTIPRVVGENLGIYRDKLNLEEGLSRIYTYYEAYHAALASLIFETRTYFGWCLVLDFHSMPTPALGSRHMPHIVLGDRFGYSCDAQIRVAFEKICYSQGLSVIRNQPYAGGFITKFYGQPHLGQHVLQIEIARELYMDQKNIDLNQGFNVLQRRLMNVIETICEQLKVLTPQTLHGHKSFPHPLAAE